MPEADAPQDRGETVRLGGGAMESGMPTEPGAALAHLKVVDLSRILAGPWATQTLADLGAEVLKIEHPAGGDDTRRWGPPFLEEADGARGDAAYFTAANRNKRSLGIDFAKPEGAALVRALIAGADVVVENFKVGGLAKYGLDYASLAAAHPRLVYCSITGFGQTGPYAPRSGYDFIIQGMGGLMGITGQPDGTPGAGPVKVGVAVADLFTGMYAATSILAALAYRDRTGRGQHIDCALLASQAAMLANQASSWLAGGVEPGRMGNDHPSISPYRVYPVRDGHVILTCGNDGQFRRFCAAVGAEGLAEDPRFGSNPERVAHRAALDREIEAVLAGFDRDDLIARLEAATVPCGPINGVADVFADPHLTAIGTTVPTHRPDGTEIPTVAYPARLSASPAAYRSAPPRLGADTEAVLQERLGLDVAAIARLRADGVL